MHGACFNVKVFKKITNIVSLCLILFIGYLQHARSEDESSIEKIGSPIIRQINKVNDDGTYTFGYEAADGSFKIETRDVLGNVKGMFGFVDESGGLKRVSYTANNETGFRNSFIHVPVQTTARPLNIPGRRPVLILKNTPAFSSSTKGPVIQHIPKKLQKEEENSSFTATNSEEYINGRRFPSYFNNNNSAEDHADESLKAQGFNPLRKVLVSKRPIAENKDDKGKGGNNLRRQLNRGLDLRDETAHIYSGGDSRSENLSPHLSALMSELRPIQVVRSSPESVAYQPIDVEAVGQEINEATTTEIPYGNRKFVQPNPHPGFISAKYRQRPIPESDDRQYLQEIQPSQNIPLSAQVPQSLPVPINLPFGSHPTSNYQTYDQTSSMILTSLRDELFAIINNYLQLRLNSFPQNPYYASSYPRYSYTNPYISPLPYANPNHNSFPYINPYLNTLPQYYPSYHNNGILPVPSQTPYSGPNVQFSPQRDRPRRIPSTRIPDTRPNIDDADLLQMLLASPTRIPINQLKYSTPKERIISSKITQPVRNVQIITDSTPVTTDLPVK